MIREEEEQLNIHKEYMGGGGDSAIESDESYIFLLSLRGGGGVEDYLHLVVVIYCYWEIYYHLIPEGIF